MFLPHRLLHALKVLVTEPDYFIARIRTIIYQFRHPDHPWLTRDAVSYLDAYLKEDMTGFEWGSGRSTVWFAKKGVRLVSVEDNPEWYEKTKGQLAGYDVDYVYIKPENRRDLYPDKISEYPDNTFDFVIVDGSFRDSCIRNTASKVKPGGIVIVDNADQDIDTSPLGAFERITTNNGVWRTDIFFRKQ